jgi:hypothetical protein
MEGMEMHSINQRERGVAMMVVLFALLLLSVVGLGMMYSTNMETSINGNYRDKQVGFYAAMAGLQEGHERIRVQGYSGTNPVVPIYSITPPIDLPTPSQTNVIYIVSNAANVKPWDTTPGNPYFDTELCHENVLSLTGMPGVPCTTIASGSGWYQTFDDSLTSAAPWKLTNPLDWKWTRITLKGNNMTSYPVNGNATDPSEACWDGKHEISTPTGYTTGCNPVGGVTAILVTSSGQNYTSTGPTVTIGGDGTGATATAIMSPQFTGYLATVNLTSGGSGYTSAPTVTVTGDGTGATVTATLSSSGTTTSTVGVVTSITLLTGGTGYTTAPFVTLTGGGGSGATATATLSTTGVTVTNGYVASVNLTSNGTAYTSPPTITFNGGGGMGAAATAVLSTTGSITSVSLSSPGTQCYSGVSDVFVAFSGGGGSGASATGVLETNPSCIYSVSVPSTQCNNKLDSTTGYNPASQEAGVTLTSGNNSFSGTLFVASGNKKTPTSLTVQNPGYDTSGYSSPTFTSTLELYNNGSGYTNWPVHSGLQDCNNITVTATTGRRLASINLTSGGSGYTPGTTVNITGGIGSTSQPTATATLGYSVASVTITDGGNYNSTPFVSFSGGGGSGVAGTPVMITSSTTTYPVASLTLTSGGLDYTTAPTVSFSGGLGSGAAASASIAPATTTIYPVASLTISNGGSGYSYANFSFSGGSGTGAAATGTISTMNAGTYWVSGINVTNPGSGYTYNPPVTFSGGGGGGAAARSVISGGTKLGAVYLITSLAQTKTGARSMLQMEVASPVLGIGGGGALTLDGPSPIITTLPNSSNFTINGNDQNTCNDATPDSPHPAIDGYDDPNNPTTPSAVTDIINAIPSGRTGDYIGAGPTPSVQNGYAGLGPTLTTPTGVSQVITRTTNIATGLTSANGGNVYSGTPANVTNANIALGSCPTGNVNDASCHTVVDVVQGNLTLSGSGSGYGILLVEGTLSLNGDFHWYGPIFVFGDGIFNYGGGGNAVITGQLYVSKIWNGNNVNYPSNNLLGTNDVGQPTFGWNGGGTNSILYDHCWSKKLINQIQGGYTSTDAYKVLSFRVLPY